MFELSTSQWYGNGEVRVEKIYKHMCVEIYGYDNLYLSKFKARIFSWKHSSTFVGNMSIYSVGTESVYQIAQSSKTKCFASVLREGLPASYSRNTTVSICTDSSHSSHVQGTYFTSRDA